MLCLALPARPKVLKLDFQSEFSVSKIKKMVKSGLIFDQAAKLGKASRDANNPGLWLILKDLLKNCVANGVASDVNS